MEIYKEMYLHLFNRVTDAEQAIEAGEILRALQILKQAQQDCEERYLEKEEP